MTITRSPRAWAALLGITASTVGFMLLPAAASAAGTTSTPSASNSQGASGSPSPSPSKTSTPTPTPTPTPTKSHTPPPKKHHKLPGTTVTGPKMWNPKKNRKFSFRSTVTVSQTKNLTNEMIQINWTGFTPSSNTPYDPGATNYPVMIVECNSAHPTKRSECYGANNGGTAGAFGPDGPLNSTYATTSPNGTGEADIQILISAQNALLGCGRDHPCSVVIVPAQGGNDFTSPPDCNDHSQDEGGFALGEFSFGQYYQCSWADRIVVPLTFIKAATNCPIKSAAFTALGSPMLARAIENWTAYLCAGTNPMSIVYNPSITEPEAIQDVPLGLGDVALTTRPGPTKIGTRSYTYAPLSISAVSVAYWIDNPKTGQPYTDLKLDPRLVAKLLTLSYNFDNEGCGQGKPPRGIGCDNAVDGNPISLFTDPEFKRLNPHLQSPTGYDANSKCPRLYLVTAT